MVAAFPYLIYRFFYRIWLFLLHWYGDGFFFAWNMLLETLRSLDRVIALKITLRYFFQPLYRDYTTVGYLLGFIFRSIRVVFGALLYLIIFVIALSLYCAWAAIPLYLIYRFIGL